MNKQNRLFTDIDAIFDANPNTGDVSIKTGERAIKFAVKSLVLTQNYERLFHSEIGTPIKKMLFENFDDMTNIILRQSIVDVITNFEPRVRVDDVIIRENRNQQSLDVLIQFTIKNSEKPLDVSVTLERTR
jgi:phage baseplate assembly protein W